MRINLYYSSSDNAACLQMMEDNINDNPTKVDWRNATLKDYFMNTRRDGPMSAELAKLTFDFTKPLGWELLHNHASIVTFFNKMYAENLSMIGQPSQSNFEAGDYYECRRSNCNKAVTIVYQTKLSSKISGEKINISKIERMLKNATKVLYVSQKTLTFARRSC